MLDKKSRNRIGYVDLYPWMSMPVPLFIVSIIFCPSSIIYAYNTREIEDLVRVAGIPAVVLTGIFFLAGLTLFRKPSHNGERMLGLITMAGAPLVAALTSTFYFCLGILLWDVFRRLYRSWTLQMGSVLAISTITIISGSILFLFRLKARTLYGLTEVVAGISIASLKFLEVGSTSALLELNFYLVVLTAGVYLVVRGFDNMHQGVFREPADPLATNLVAWWKTLGQHLDSHNSKPRLESPTRARLKAMRDRNRRFPR